MMQGVPPALVVVPLEKREAGDPDRLPFAGPREAEALGELQAECAQRLRCDAGVVCNEQKEIAGRSLERFGERPKLLRREELRHGRAPARWVGVLDVCPDEPTG